MPLEITTSLYPGSFGTIKVMLRRLSAAFSMLLLLQLSLQVGGAACESEHSQNDAVAFAMHTVAASAMDMTAGMPMDSHQPCDEMQGPLSCDGPWAPTTCAAMVMCHVALAVNSARLDDIVIERPTMNFGAFPPLHASATVTPQPPPPRA